MKKELLCVSCMLDIKNQEKYLKPSHMSYEAWSYLIRSNEVRVLDEKLEQINFVLNDCEEMFSEEIKSWGNSAHIPMKKKLIGKRVIILVQKDKELQK